MGTSRQPFKLMRVPDENGLDKVEAMKNTYKKLKLDCLVVLGGNGSQKTTNLLRQEGLNVIGLPKTIDNDLWGTYVTFGFHTFLSKHQLIVKFVCEYNAQRMQRQMEEQQKELEEKEFTASVGGGVVKVTVSGKREVTNVELAEEAVDPDDIETLQDLIVAAVNEAMRQVDEASSQSMGKLAGGLGGSLGGLGGGFPF